MNKILFFNITTCCMLISCDLKSNEDYRNTATEILAGTLGDNVLYECSEIQKIHTKYASENKGANDIMHFLSYINYVSHSDEQAAFYSALFIHELINNEPDWGKSLFFVDKNEIRRVINYFDAIYDKSIYRKLLIKSGADYFSQYHNNLAFNHFEFFDPQFKKVSTDKYDGKILVIDFGASWCSPCKEQAPYLEEIRKHFENDNVQFISISLDKDQSKWLKYYNKTTKRNNLQHGIIDNASLEKFSLKYGLGGIPRYFIVDKSGKYVTYNAPKPQSDVFPMLISQQLMKE